MNHQDPSWTERDPQSEQRKGGHAIAAGLSVLLLLVVALLVTLVVTVLSHEPEAQHAGVEQVASNQRNAAAPENDATYGLDLDKQTIARAVAKSGAGQR